MHEHRFATDPCPLCASQAAELLERIPYDLIWAGLARLWPPGPSEVVVARHTPDSHADLYACRTCDLHFFSPLNPGDAAFYAELASSSSYYHEDRWEFSKVAARVRDETSVVDFGCGRGDFLRRLGAAGRRLVGVDHNTEAVEDLRRVGIEAHAADFASFARSHQGEFEAASAFHTLEHMPEVATLVDSAVQCLRPQGRLFLSVPNRDRVVNGLQPADCPPHHVSRWGPRQFEILADRFGLDLIQISYQRRNVWHAHRVVPRTLRAAWHRLSGDATPTELHAEQRSGPVPVGKSTRRSPKAMLASLTFGETMLGEFRRRARTA